MNEMDYFIDIESFKDYIIAGHEWVDITTSGQIKNRINFTKQKTGYGFKCFLVCPKCGSRCTKLYYYCDSYLCRCCYPRNIYRITQHTIKGGYEHISNIMYHFGKRHGFEFARHPFHYYKFEVPKHKHREKWLHNLAIMQALANMRFQSIFLKRRWSNETIKSVLSGRNALLYLYDLSDIDEYILDWDKGMIAPQSDRKSD